jgi:hypothetical protein
VKLESSNHNIIAGDSFYLTLYISNPSNFTVTNIGITLTVTDYFGQEYFDRFTMATPTVTGIVNNINGNGSLPAYQQAKIVWKVTSIADGSFFGGATSFNLGGEVAYSQDSGDIIIPFFDAVVINYPPTILGAHYFVPATFSAESPTTIGVIVTNNGYGNAHEITVDSILANMVDSSG